MYEGFWKRSENEDSDLPWPKQLVRWRGREAFINALDEAEKRATRVAYRGFSKCRLCGCRNGHETLQLEPWEWPAGYRHYVAAHFVLPSPAFEAFITARR